MPDANTSVEGNMSKKKAAQAAKAQEKWEAEYARLIRIKKRSRATLIVCPLSTVVNWEDQFKEHWAGEVLVTGGAGASCVPHDGAIPQANSQDDDKPCAPYIRNEGCSSFIPAATHPNPALKSSSQECTPLRVYVYHGNARRPDPDFLADFDAVITTYSTLASEYSKQMRSIAVTDSEDAIGDESGDSSITGGQLDVEEGRRLTSLKKGVKRKKASCFINGGTETSSPLQSIHWFRVVLDEAQYVACRLSTIALSDTFA